jgi:hypothetical protein
MTTTNYQFVLRVTVAINAVEANPSDVLSFMRLMAAVSGRQRSKMDPGKYAIIRDAYHAIYRMYCSDQTFATHFDEFAKPNYKEVNDLYRVAISAFNTRRYHVPASQAVQRPYSFRELRASAKHLDRWFDHEVKFSKIRIAARARLHRRWGSIIRWRWLFRNIALVVNRMIGSED